MERINKPRLIHRLNLVEGQVRGISRMVAQDRYCVDILTQLHAARAALRRVERDCSRTTSSTASLGPWPAAMGWSEIRRLPN